MKYNIKNILLIHGFGDKENYQNIYINLYKALKLAIVKNALKSHAQLPPTRVLAKDIGVSRSTVIKAYDLLVLEKYVNTKVGSGYYVNSSKSKKLQTPIGAKFELGDYPKISKRGLAFKSNIQIINNYKSNTGIAFRPGLPPLDIFPVSQWKNLVNNYWKTVKASELSYSHTTGINSLKKNISNYLKIYRNIDCDPNQVVITTGSLHSLSLIGDALIDKNDEVVIENPTYPYAYNLFNSLKSKICPAPIDKEGMELKNLKVFNPKIIYTTPSNQYPTGVKMSLERRLELVKWASSKNAIIVEDDYDHEFSNWENPISSIYSLDKQERVVYLGTFNKLLHPSLRLGYMIVPHYLLDTVTALYQQSSRFVNPASQKILSAFIEKDYLNKHIRHVLEVSLERKSVFLDSFSNHLEEYIDINNKNSGLHIIGHLDKNINDQKLSDFLKTKGITTHPYSLYFIEGKKRNGLIMGYSSVNNKTIKETIFKMKNEVDNFKN
ncbi:hypothetical protein APS56_08950 [Pseudalgibacter alginicilyticus]|uniref:HTH gntR-type domain-containing protein n=1 Tax=Pseudalgibacter alginicilyticus TaxID=1736674 RepID=A0A0P0D2V2_9FLAO|nr:PLP-dependent aminotransferase family protein [Pseudalgibacter alginicilyticus]ALJ05244.1 hypothetical protein APS56_08950 [Pseudalgibacter alginicilyticus]